MIQIFELKRLDYERAQKEIEKLKKEMKKMDNEIKDLERDAKDYERIKRIQESAHDNEDQYLKSVKETGSAQEQAKTFYEFLRIKKADLKKSKDELQRVLTELAHYKDKSRTLEAALQKKQTTTIASSIPNKQLERRTTSNEPPIRGAAASFEEKQERLLKAQKSQNEIQMEKLAKENIQDFYDMASLEEETKNYSIKGSEEKQKPKKETPDNKDSGIKKRSFIISHSLKRCTIENI